MVLVYHVTAETLRQLSRIVSQPGLRSKFTALMQRGTPMKPRQDVPVLELRLSDEEREAVERDLSLALNEHGFEDGGVRTPCGHVYEGLLRLIRKPNWRLA